MTARAWVLAALAVFAAFAARADWAEVERAAWGQTVYWHAWGGDPRVNAYIAWAGETVAERHGVQVVHVKLTDTAEAVSRVLAEVTAGRTSDGAVDLIWINGENFAAMKAGGLLHGPWVQDLPNWPLVDAGNPGVTRDFTVPTEGFEAPWGLAQLVFFHDTARTPPPPRRLVDLLDWARANPGRLTYPQPPDFLGTTFLKQALVAFVDPATLAAPVDPAAYPAQVAPLWAWLEALSPHLWRGGRAYPPNGPSLRQLLADGEIDIAFSFNPAEASAAIADGTLPDTVRSYVLDGGTLGNASFVAIPVNARAVAGAKVLANFLLSPEAQARKQDPAVWGGATVLDLARLAPADRARFDALDLGPATLGPQELGPVLPEPHPSWVGALEADWQVRFGTR